MAKQSILQIDSLADQKNNTQTNNQNMNFSNGERTLLKLKINELEKELKELREENDFVHKTLVDISQKQVEDFKGKVTKNTGLDVTNKSLLIGKLKTGLSKLVVKDYNIKQI